MTLHTAQSILDFKNTMLGTFGYSTMAGILLLLFWWRNRQEKGLLTLGAAAMACSFGALHSVLPAFMPAWPALILDMFLLLLFHPMALIALQQMFGRRIRPWTHALVMALAMGVFIYVGHAAYAKRVMVTSSLHVFYWLWVLRLLWQERARATPYGHALAACTGVAILALAAWRGGYAALAGDANFNLSGQLFNLYTALGLFWSAFCFCLSVLCICYERVWAQLSREARQDGLTRLLNPRAFRELGNKACGQAAPLALLMIDLDHFKSVNDRFGHWAGDQVLAQLADCLRGQARRSDLLGRYGGEEFVMLLPNTQADEAALAAERLRGAIEALNPHCGAAPLPITASIGVAWIREGGRQEDIASLFARADKLLYQAKRKGRNRVEVSIDAEEALRFGETAVYPASR
ncbi:diguanylate cyclase [Chromobacterium sp. IIBBL 290-4]|uniref:GGDEF domain-containing protein n=1 Tax=Chromobacterium sp. IIBBL 290-4 TaxID=2953890 RepID=UPI0020B65C05|nr:GGDEF domain-containing protein [Chromobacterium sp. IIBBL 290-4]UTH74912.1 GGDEF domain-containing protein [Chromobacterium sp. IIBBL 290-4]